MTALLSNRVAIVTGAGGGLGQAHALALARSGARVLVNDLDEMRVEKVCKQIESFGAQALGSTANVQDFDAVEHMMKRGLDRWGQIDILVNNAGILRDRTFAKLDLVDFRLVMDVHVMGAVNCTKAVWVHMKERRYGRVILTTSSSGLYGNFGQSAYSTAKMGLVGLMHTLALEGVRYGIHVNCLAPSAATQMTNELWSPEDLAVLDPVRVSPAVVALASEAAPNKHIVLAGAGSFKSAYITMTDGMHFTDDQLTPENILSHWGNITDRTAERVPATGAEQYQFESQCAQAAQKNEER